MEEELKVKESIRTRISVWWQDPYNKVFSAILIFFIILRFYWFFKLGNQPVWWDEADYMNIAKTWLGFEYWRETYLDIGVVRPVLFPLIASVFFFLRLGETSIRIFILLSSIVSIPLIYGVGKLFFNKKIALVSSFILAVFWSFAFFSHRLLVDVPIMMLWLAAVYIFFNSYFKDKNWKHFVFAGILLGASFLMKFSSVMLVFIFAVYLFATEKFKIFKNKKIIIFYLASFLTVLPYFIWQYIEFGSPFAFYIKATQTRGTFRSFTQSLIDQTLFSVKAMHWTFLILFLVGLFVVLFYIFLSWEKTIVKKSDSNKYLFILIWLVLSLLFFGWMNYGTYMEERYFFVFYPALFLLAGVGLNYIYKTSRNYNKPIAVILILAILGFGAYQNVIHSNQLIEAKKGSFNQLKLAGEFIKENTNPEDTVLILEETAEISYYSERNFIHIGGGKNSTFIMEKIQEYKPKYAVLSFFFSASTPEYYEAINFVLSNPSVFIPVQTYSPYIGQEQKLPIAMILKINPQ